MLRRVALVRTDLSEELSASIRVTRISELGTTIFVTLMKEALSSPETSLLTRATRLKIPEDAILNMGFALVVLRSICWTIKWRASSAKTIQTDLAYETYRVRCYAYWSPVDHGDRPPACHTHIVPDKIGTFFHAFRVRLRNLLLYRSGHYLNRLVPRHCTRFPV
jgi:hypothetical protein